MTTETLISELPANTAPTATDNVVVDSDATGTRKMSLSVLAQYIAVRLLEVGMNTAIVPWANIIGKPALFTPDAHVHPTSEITGLDDALALLAPKASPALTGTPTAPTATTGTNTTQIATTAFVKAALDALVNAAPGLLDTLDELAAAIGDDPNFAATMATALGQKLAKASNLSDLADAAAARTNLGLNTSEVITALLDVIGSTRGDVLYRGASGWSVLAPGTAGNMLVTGGAGADPSWTAPGTPADGSITNAKLADVATGTIKGRSTAGAGAPEDMTAATVRALLAKYCITQPQGRLTLTSATPVLSSSVTGATTVYYTAHNGRHVPIYDGTTWLMVDMGGELSQATTDSTKSPAACTTSTNYDLFVWSDSGTMRCTRGPAWSASGFGSSSRGTGAGTTELEYVGGILVNKVAITNGPAAQRGTYVGTIRTNASSTVDFIFGGIAAGGTTAVFNVWNAYNRVRTSGFVGNSTDTWTYATGSWRQAAGSATMQAEFVSGLAADSVMGHYACHIVTGASYAQIGLGYDSVLVVSGQTGHGPASYNMFASSHFETVPAAGAHRITALEFSNGTTTTFYGDWGVPTAVQHGLYFSGAF